MLYIYIYCIYICIYYICYIDILFEAPPARKRAFYAVFARSAGRALRLFARGRAGKYCWRHAFRGGERFLLAASAKSIHRRKRIMFISRRIRWGEHPRCQPGNVRFLEASSDGASIHCCQPGNVRFLEASDGASIHRCQLGNVRFLEASDGASIHRCQLGNVRFLEASEGASIHVCWRSQAPCSLRRFVYRHV